MIKNENYITIQGWMVNELNLKGNDLFIYAIIYGFTQDGDNNFTGSLRYLSEWCNSSKQGVLNSLSNLVKNDFIKKIDIYKNGVKFVEYHATKLEELVKKVDKNDKNGSQKSLPNNTINLLDNNINKIEKKNIKKENLNSILKTYNNQIEELINIFPKRSDITNNDIETAKRHIGRALLESSNKELLLSEMKSGVDRYMASLKSMQFCKKVNKWFGEASWTASYENVSEVQNTPQKPLLSASKDEPNYFITVLNNEIGAIIGYEWCNKYKMKYLEKYKNRENLFALKDILKNEKEQDLSQIKNEFCLTFKNNWYSVFVEQANDKKMKDFFDELLNFTN